MYLGNSHELVVVENVISAFGKWPPGFYLNVVFNEEFLSHNLLAKGMRFNLVDSRGDLIMHNQVHHPVRVEVAYTNRTHATIPV